MNVPPIKILMPAVMILLCLQCKPIGSNAKVSGGFPTEYDPEKQGEGSASATEPTAISAEAALFGLNLPGPYPENINDFNMVEKTNELNPAWLRIEFVADAHTIGGKSDFKKSLELSVQYLRKWKSLGYRILLLLDYKMLYGAQGFNKPHAPSISGESLEMNQYIQEFLRRTGVLINILAEENINIDAFEIWNEQDLSQQSSYDPGLRGQDYTKILQGCIAAIRSQSLYQNSYIVTGGVHSVDKPDGWTMMKNVLSALTDAEFNSIDGLGVHTYGTEGSADKQTRFFDEIYANWTSEIEKAFPGKKKLSLWFTEIGTPFNREGEVSSDAYLKLAYEYFVGKVKNENARVKSLFYFALHNQENFGLLDASGQARSTFNSYKVLSTQYVPERVVSAPAPPARSSSQQSISSQIKTAIDTGESVGKTANAVIEDEEDDEESESQGPPAGGSGNPPEVINGISFDDSCFGGAHTAAAGEIQGKFSLSSLAEAKACVLRKLTRPPPEGCDPNHDSPGDRPGGCTCQGWAISKLNAEIDSCP